MRNYEISNQRASMTAKDSYQMDDEYEEDGYEEYEEEASEDDLEYEEEAPKPTKEEQEFLKLREKLKNQIREKMKNQTAKTLGNSSSSQDKRRSTTSDTFGSFFGPSQPVIAQRVIEESRSMRENKHIMANTSSSSSNKKDPTSSVVRPVVSHQHSQRPKVVNEAKRKAQTLKDMRDYSFLFSDDADIPETKERIAHLPKKELSTHPSKKEQHAPRRFPAPKSDIQSAQAPSKSKLPSGKPVRLPSMANGVVKNPVTTKQHPNIKAGSLKEVPARRPMPPTSDESRRSGGVVNQLSKPAGNGALQRKVSSQSNSMNSMNKVVSNPSLKNNPSSARQPHSSTQKNYREQKKSAEGQDRRKLTMKQPMASSKVQPSKQISSRSVPNEHRKKRPIERNASDDEVDYRSMIRGMFGYNPNKYAQMDEDDSDMEVGFDVIQREELRSAKIAREEDDEQLRLIEEEEERERQRRLKKKLKRG